MRLEHVSIENCGRISDVSIDVRDNLVLIGPNGSGKTTLLLCLDLLLGTQDGRISGAAAVDLVRDVQRPMTVEAVFANLDDDELSRFSGAVDAAKGNKLLARLEARADGDDVAITRSFPGARAWAGPDGRREDAFGWKVAYNQAGLLDARGVWKIAQNPGRADGMQTAAATAQPATVPAIREQLNAESGILAIDEPEAHLHPSSQRSLAKMLKAGASQKVLVTHSPTIAGSFEPDEIVVIRSDGCAVQPRAGFLKGNAGTLARWWIGKQLEPLTAGSVIAVEGPSDRIIVDKVAGVCGFDLDRHDVVLVETSGCGDMKVIESIFGRGGFDIPLFELIDQDAADDAAARLGIAQSRLETRNVFVSTRDLEDEYVQAIGAKRLWDAFKAAHTFSASALTNCKTGAGGYPTEADLAQFIRSKSRRKIPAALVAAGLIDASNARRVRSVAKLIEAAS